MLSWPRASSNGRSSEGLPARATTRIAPTGALRGDDREALPARRQRGILVGELPETVHDAVAQRRFESDEDKAFAPKHAINSREVIGVGAQQPMTIHEPQVRALGHRRERAMPSPA